MTLRHTLLALGLASALAGCATDPLTDAAATAPGSPAASLKRLGQTTLAAGDYPSAVGFFRRAHAENEQDFEAAYGLGLSLLRVGANDQAAEMLRKALALRPDDPNARRELGNALIALGRPSLALVEFDAAFDRSQDARCLNGMGIALDLMGNQPAAQAQYRAGLKLDPGNTSLRNNLALSLAVTGSYAESLALLEPVVRAPGATVRQRQNLALIYGLAGEPDRAAAVARVDLDETSVRKNLVFYETLRAMNDPRKVAEAVGLRPAPANSGL
jgi:Flp pilus assembly protein TadD